MIITARSRLILVLLAVFVCVGPSAVSPSPSKTLNPTTPIFPTFYEHRWPTENPNFSTREGCGYFQPEVSAVLGEFRTDGGPHYHGGVDIPDPANNPVYGVLQDLAQLPQFEGVG